MNHSESLRIFFALLAHIMSPEILFPTAGDKADPATDLNTDAIPNWNWGKGSSLLHGRQMLSKQAFKSAGAENYSFFRERCTDLVYNLMKDGFAPSRIYITGVIVYRYGHVIEKLKI